MAQVDDHNATVDQLVELMEEFRLSSAKLQRGDFVVSFSRPVPERPRRISVRGEDSGEETYEAPVAAPIAAPVPVVPKGTPITSPMTGIYYGSPSPSAPAFVKEGDVVTTGQTVGLIEAMKVFNEIPCAISGTVLEVVATSGQIVNPGDVLLRIG